MNKKRPINLDLTTIDFPVMAIVSILHRISGVVLFLLFPIVLYFLGQSLANAARYYNLYAQFSHNIYYQLTLWAFGAAIIYHLLAGSRHLIMDLGYADGLAAGKFSAIVVIISSIFLSLLLGIWLW